MSKLVCLFALLALVVAPRLNYQQEKELKDATYFLDQAEGTSQALEEKLAKMNVGDASVLIQTVENYQAAHAKAAQYVSNANNRLTKLPTDNSDVKEQVDRATTVGTSLDKSAAKLKQLHDALAGVVNQGAGAGFQADFDRLQDICKMFADPQIFEGFPKRAIEVVEQMKAVNTERERIATKYADLLKQETDSSRRMNGILRHFDEVFADFSKATAQYAQEAPAQIQADLDNAMKQADGAVKNQTPAYFGEQGGVKQSLDHAQTRSDVLAAIAPNSALSNEAIAKIKATRDNVAQMRASLNDAIIASNQVPTERYSGPDKQQLTDLVKTKWAESKVAGDVLASGINSASWQRDTRWRWDGQDTWNKIDTSFIQGFVVVKTDATHASIHFINLVKDHLQSDRITTHFFEDPKVAPDVTRQMLVANVK